MAEGPKGVNELGAHWASERTNTKARRRLATQGRIHTVALMGELIED